MTLSAQTSSKWPKVRFGDVVRNVDQSVRDPQTCGLERYVGLEHIDPESLHIQRWGLIAEGTTFTRRFRKGQVLFGKRRAYQRKVAVAEFDGLCSSDILVFEPKDDRLLPELLPFICQTESFFEHALDTSAGSLSPRTKFKELARYEFPLPPLDEQRRIAEILGSADEVLSKYENVMNQIIIMSSRVFEETLRSSLSTQQVCLDDVCQIQNGQVDPTVPPYNRMIHIAPDDIESETGRILETKTATEDKVKSGKYLFDHRAILYSKIRPNLKKVTFPKFSGVCSADVYPLYPSEIILPEFLFYLLLSDDFTKYAITNSVRSAIPKINRDDLLSYKFSLPNKDDQTRLIGQLEAIRSSKDVVQSHLSIARGLKKALLLSWK